MNKTKKKKIELVDSITNEILELLVSELITEKFY